MDKLKYIQDKLAKHIGEFSDIARHSGVSRPTVINVANGKNPTMATVEKLYGYLKTLRGKK